MKEPILLEICAGSLVSALIAQTAGAHRIELCENLLLGGTTPSFGTLSLVRQMVKIPVYVLIRPRGGNFVYSEFELSVMKMDIECCKMLGFDGVVFGILKEDLTINVDHCKQLLELARPMQVTFHKAFDETNDPFSALQTLINLGFDRVLTSGTKENAIAGKEILSQLVKQAGDKIIIMPGGSIRPENLKEIINFTSAKEYHSSAVNHDSTSNETDLQTVENLIKLLS
ncbi:MAG: copper homeostasis protein CutC [Bacteroidales bacterium]